MKNILLIIVVFFFITADVFSQNAENSISQFDDAVRVLAREIHTKLAEKNAERISIGQFLFQNSGTPFSAYWTNQLTGELVNMPRRNYTVYPAGTAGAEWIISGEIIRAGGNVRIYTQLIRSSNRAIEAVFYTNFQQSDQLNQMLAFSGNAGFSSSGEGVDIYEPDSWENPVPYTIGSGSQSAVVINRFLFEDDEDFFLLIPERSGRLTIETISSIDTFMYLFDYDTEEQLAWDDDSGQGLNARIIFNVRAGTRYIAIVRGFRSTITGPYGFRAFITIREGASSWEEPAPYEIGMGEANAVSVQRSLQSGDQDYFLLVPTENGRLTIETTGSTDTYIEFFDADTEELLDEDDDSGENLNARIRYNVRAGGRYIAMVRGYSTGTAGRYSFRAFFPSQGLLPPDEFEPDDEPSLAKEIYLGVPQQRTFHSRDDVDWVFFRITQSGRYVINARGVNNNLLDTYVELFDANLNFIGEDDDGGEGLSARLSVNLNPGTYYIKVWCLSENPDQAYILRVDSQ